MKKFTNITYTVSHIEGTPDYVVRQNICVAKHCLMIDIKSWEKFGVKFYPEIEESGPVSTPNNPTMKYIFLDALVIKPLPNWWTRLKWQRANRKKDKCS